MEDSPPPSSGGRIILLSPSEREYLTSIATRLRQTALKQCLPLGLMLAILFGVSVPIVGATVASWHVAGRGAVQTVCVWVIFTISGMTLKTDDVLKALSAWRAILFGFASILFVTPLLAPAVGAIPLSLRPEFSIGFVLFCSMPTTINSGVALVVQAKGSFALALMLTVSTNLAGVFTVPFFLSIVLQLDGAVPISPSDLLVKLLVLILVPLVIGKVVREVSMRVQAFVKAHKQGLSLTANSCLVLIPWMKLSESQAALVAAGPGALAVVIMVGITIHVVYLAWSYGMARILRLPEEELRAVVIMGSQKTLPMAMAVLAALPDSIGEHGLIAVPPIIAHLTQIFMDAWIATRWAHSDPEPPEEPHAAQEPVQDHEIDVVVVTGGTRSLTPPILRRPTGQSYVEFADRTSDQDANAESEAGWHAREARDSGSVVGSPPGPYDNSCLSTGNSSANEASGPLLDQHESSSPQITAQQPVSSLDVLQEQRAGAHSEGWYQPSGPDEPGGGGTYSHAPTGPSGANGNG